MAFERWLGGIDQFSNPSAWSPALVPQSGDTAVIASGTVGDTSATAFYAPPPGLNLFAIAKAGSPPPVIASTYWTFDRSTVVLDNRANTAVMSFAGGKYFSNAGTMEFVGGRFRLSHTGMVVDTFTNTGTMSLVDADMTVTASAPNDDLANDGYLTLAGTTQLSGVIGGSGTIVIEPNAAVTLSQAVSGTQTIQFAGTSTGTVLTLAQPAAIAATLAGFAQGDRIVLSGLDSSYTATYTQSAAAAGTLTLTSATRPTVTLTLAGTYQTSDFTLAPDARGLSLKTRHTGTAIPDPTGHDGRQVYRFFDTVNGTHFYTPNIAERDDIPALRSDMVYEGAAFRDADPTADPAAAPIFRFFDTVSGTHFFTGSQPERDQLLATRPDLTFEGIGFYEHRTAQPGDTPVARFFETRDGSHLYVQSATETASIQATRPDLTYEGTAFYAPTT